MLRNYIKIAFKVMLRQKFFTIISLFGISFTIMIFSVSTGLFALSYGDHAPAVHRSRTIYFESLSFLSGQNADTFTHLLLDDDFYKKLRKSAEIEDICVYRMGSTHIFRNDKVVSFSIGYTDASFWNIYNYQFLEGRPYNAKDVAEGKAYAVITESIKNFYFGSQSALGKRIGDEDQFTIIGVVKDAIVLNAEGPEQARILVPYQAHNIWYKSIDHAILLARKKSDISLIKEQLEHFAKQSDDYKRLKGSWVRADAGTIFEKKNFKEGSIYLSLFLFFIVAIPALNLVGLNVGRIAERSSEIGIRKAFGASSNVLAGQFIIENLIITGIGGILGIAFTYVASDLMIDIVFYDETESVNAAKNFLINWNTILASIFAIFFFGILSGILPAWRMSRLHAIKALKGGSVS